MIRRLTLPFLLLYALFLRYCIWETEHYLRDCYADGLRDSLALRDFRAQLEAMRVRLANVHALMASPRAGDHNPWGA